MAKKYKWLALGALIPALAITYLDKTIVPVALIAIQNDFQTSHFALQWCVNSYLLSTTALILLAGKLGDRMGHKTALLWGVVIFFIASLLCALSPNVFFLIFARTLKGLGAAFILTAQPALLGSIFPSSEVGRAMGLNTSMSSLFMILGPFIGGYIVELISWRSIFWMNLPMAVLSFFMILYFVPRIPSAKVAIDFQGFFLFALFSSHLIFLVMQCSSWNEWALLFCLSVVLLSSVLLVKREKKVKEPFLGLSLFANPPFMAVCLLIGTLQFLLMINVYRAIYFQKVLEYSPSAVGRLLFYSCIPVFFFSQIAGILSVKIGPKIPMMMGFLFLMYSFISMAFFPTDSWILFPMVAFGIGLPLILTPSHSAVFGMMSIDQLGRAFGVIGTLRAFSASLGVAMLTWLTHSLQNHYLHSFDEKLSSIKVYSLIHFGGAAVVFFELFLVYFVFRRLPSASKRFLT